MSVEENGFSRKPAAPFLLAVMKIKGVDWVSTDANRRSATVNPSPPGRFISIITTSGANRMADDMAEIASGVVVISWPSDLRRMPSARASFLSSSTSKTFIMQLLRCVLAWQSIGIGTPFFRIACVFAICEAFTELYSSALRSICTGYTV